MHFARPLCVPREKTRFGTGKTGPSRRESSFRVSQPGITRSYKVVYTFARVVCGTCGQALIHIHDFWAAPASKNVISDAVTVLLPGY